MITKNQCKITLFLITIIALFLRLFNLMGKTIWFDESVSVYFSSVPFYEHFFSNMMTYYSFLSTWNSVFGIGLFQARIFSILLSLLSIYLIFIIGRKFFNLKIGLLSALLMSISSFYLYFSQTAKLYPLTVVLVLLSVYYFLDLLEKPTKKNYLFYIISTVGLIYTNVHGVWILVFENIFFFFYGKNLKKWIKNQLKLGILLLYWFYLFFDRAIVSNLSQGSNAVFRTKATFSQYSSIFSEFSSNKFVMILFIIFTVYFLFFVLVKKEKLKSLLQIRMLFFWFFIPLVCTWIISLIGIHAFEIRYFLTIYPAFTLFFAYSVSQIKNKYFFGMVVIILLMASFYSIPAYYETDIHKPWNEIGNYINENYESTIPIFIMPRFFNITLEYAINKGFEGRVQGADSENSLELFKDYEELILFKNTPFPNYDFDKFDEYFEKEFNLVSQHTFVNEMFIYHYKK